jgi:hypothetical protein
MRLLKYIKLTYKFLKRLKPQKSQPVVMLKTVLMVEFVINMENAFVQLNLLDLIAQYFLLHMNQQHMR